MSALASTASSRMTATMQAYLEFSEDGGSGHKFYEARVEGGILNVRHTGIGTDARWPNHGGEGIVRGH